MDLLNDSEDERHLQALSDAFLDFLETQHAGLELWHREKLATRPATHKSSSSNNSGPDGAGDGTLSSEESELFRVTVDYYRDLVPDWGRKFGFSVAHLAFRSASFLLFHVHFNFVVREMRLSEEFH